MRERNFLFLGGGVSLERMTESLYGRMPYIDSRNDSWRLHASAGMAPGFCRWGGERAL